MVLFKEQDEKANILKGRKRKRAKGKAPVRAAKQQCYWKSSNGAVVEKSPEPEVASPSSFQETAVAYKRQTADEFVEADMLDSRRKTHVEEGGSKRKITSPAAATCKTSPAESEPSTTSAGPSRSTEEVSRTSTPRRNSSAAITPRKSADTKQEINAEIEALKAELVDKDNMILESQKHRDKHDRNVAQAVLALRKMIGQPSDGQASSDDSKSNCDIIQNDLRSLHAELTKAKDQVMNERKLATESAAKADAAINSLTNEKCSLGAEVLSLKKQIDYLERKAVESHDTAKKELNEVINQATSQALQLADQQSALADARLTITKLRDTENSLRLNIRQSEERFAREKKGHADAVQHLELQLEDKASAVNNLLEARAKEAKERIQLEESAATLNAAVSRGADTIAQQKDVIEQLNAQIDLRQIEKSAGEESLRAVSMKLEQANLDVARCKAELVETRKKSEEEHDVLRDQIKKLEDDVGFWKAKCVEQEKSAEEIDQLTSLLCDSRKEKDRLSEMVKQLEVDAKRLSSDGEAEIAAMQTTLSDCRNELKDAREATIRIQAVLDDERTKAYDERESHRKACQCLEEELSRLQGLVKRANTEVDRWRNTAQSSRVEIEQLQSTSNQLIAQHKIDMDELKREQEHHLSAVRIAKDVMVLELKKTAEQRVLDVARTNERNLALEEQHLSQETTIARLYNQLRQSGAEKMELKRRYDELVSAKVPSSPEPQDIKNVVEEAALIVRLARADLDNPNAANGTPSGRRKKQSGSTTKQKPSMYGHLAGGGSAKKGTARDDDEPTATSPKITYMGRRLQFRQKGKELITIHSDSSDNDSS